MAGRSWTRCCRWCQRDPVACGGVDVTPLRVFIADDHPAFRRGLAGMLSTVEGIEVVGDAPDGAIAIERVAELRPDVVLMDLHMPVMGGIEATAEIAVRSPDSAVVVLTMVEDDDALLAAMRAGATGYVLKGADQDDVVRSIRAAAAGEVIFGPGIAGRVVQLLTGRRPVTAADRFPTLTERELEVLDLVASGLRNPEIAARLVVSEKTVRNHISNIFAKLHVDRSGAIVLARDAGLGRTRTP
ncbi:MAG: response regulator transcription factor [Actinobacteria bacterium]|nr:response regulator transcription factor [Actinomycetota bacterium]